MAPDAQVPPRGFGSLELLLGGLAALGPLSIDMYLPALPAMAAEFRVDTAAVQLSLASFFVGFAVGQLVVGPFVDRYGRKRPLLLGLGLYLLASLGCAVAPSTCTELKRPTSRRLSCEAAIRPKALAPKK